MHTFYCNIMAFTLALTCFFARSAHSEIKGKVELAPALINIDILEHGKTTETLRMIGAKGDLTILVYQGLCLKPGFLLGWKDGGLAAASMGVGYYLPITDKIKILPSVGVNWSYLHTKVDFEQVGLFHLKERFRACGPYVGIEICYTFNDKLTITGAYQYAWSRTHTKIKPIISSHTHCEGSNYMIGLDYSLNKNWSVTAGFAYNLSLSKEKHGLRGKGGKIGLAYYF